MLKIFEIFIRFTILQYFARLDMKSSIAELKHGCKPFMYMSLIGTVIFSFQALKLTTSAFLC